MWGKYVVSNEMKWSTSLCTTLYIPQSVFHVTIPASHWTRYSSRSSVVHRRAIMRHLAPALTRAIAPKCIWIAVRRPSDTPRSSDPETAASTVSTSTTFRGSRSMLTGARETAGPADFIAGRSELSSRSNLVGRVVTGRRRGSPTSICRRRVQATSIGRRLTSDCFRM